MQQPKPKKRVGEMGRPDNSAAMEKEFEISFKKKGATVKGYTKAEMEEAERGNSPEDKAAKTRKQIQENEALKEKIRMSKSDKSLITKTMRALFGGK